jgi:aldehyde dehydrogenase (NAD+)
MQNLSVPAAPNTALTQIDQFFQHQQQHQWAVGRTSVKQRIEKLRRLHTCIEGRRDEIEAAVWADFHKSPTETGLTELGVVLGEIRHTIKHLADWMHPKRVSTPLTLLGSTSHIHYEPKGVVLIISPWNFPFNLTFAPLVSAIAAGNCAMIKPSEFTVHSSALMKTIVEECFPPEEIALVEGDAQVATHLLSLPFNHIFFTGSPAVGKIVMTAAAKHLASVTLELGGKSPVVVDETANLDEAAERIAWLKAMNVGQICIAPDYVIAHKRISEELGQKIGLAWTKFYGHTAQARQQSPDLCRMVNTKHFSRVKSLLDDAVQRGARLTHGGFTDDTDRFIEPTVLTQVPEQAAIWKEEIFGPLLPIRTFEDIEEAIRYINHDERPLAMYLFSRSNKRIKQVIQSTRCGGVTVNDCGPHFYNFNLPFGGSNNSGIGASHGEFGFQAFSHARSVLRQAKFLASTELLMPPYGGKLAKWLVEGVVKWF